MTMETPVGLVCEAKGHALIKAPATHIYGPECEAETGKLMYLCSAHAGQIRSWMQANPNQPVDCPTHGRIGKVKSYVILKAL